MTALIEARGLSAGYGHLAAVRDIDLAVQPGEVVALVGANGAGKSTTLLALAGWLPPMAGEVRWKGEPTTAALHKRATMGMALVTEARSIFRGLTVAGNLRVGDIDQSHALSLFPELRPLLSRRAGLLSGGEQQMLALACALGRMPALLLVDELSLGLAPIVVSRLIRAIKAVASDGVAVLVVEQHARQVLRVADRAYVLNRGRIVMEAPADELIGRLDELKKSYLATPVG
ncbi:MAG TPA: ABC transporter ATP-binding protein [Pseudonocardiaceae bacterium]|jgi:branched-chain amino acid transport system ATP-binding protein